MVEYMISCDVQQPLSLSGEEDECKLLVVRSTCRGLVSGAHCEEDVQF